MMRVFIVVSCGLVAALMGCSQGNSGDPGASSAPPKAPMLNVSENTFSLDVPEMKLKQGEAKTMSIGIIRGKNFSQDISLKLKNLPKGMTLNPANPAVKNGDAEVKISVMAAADAALGDFTARVTGHPSKGSDASSDFKLTVSKKDSKEAAGAASGAALAKWDEYTAAMQKQWEQFSAKCADLTDRAAKAEGQAKTDLDAKLAEAKPKLDAAAAKLQELKSASADRWEKVKEGVDNAFNDLKKIFE